MAFSTGGSNGGLRGRRRFGASMGTLSEMNVVPLVDVVLVLLIIFMLTAHVMDYGLEVEVPQVKVSAESNEILPVVTVKSNQLYLNDKKVNINDLAAQLNAQFKGQKDVYVRADRATRWDVLANVLSALKEAHVSLKMVTKPVESR